MKEEKHESNSKPNHTGFFHRLDGSAILTVIGIIFLFSFSVIAVLIAPRYIDSSWTSPSSPFQVQMYEVVDPNYYMSSASSGGQELQYVNHLKNHFTLLAFRERSIKKQGKGGMGCDDESLYRRNLSSCSIPFF